MIKPLIGENNYALAA